GVTFTHYRGQHVEVVALVRMHFLTVESSLDGLQPIAELGRSLERERIRRGLHLPPRFPRERFVPPFQEQHALVDRRAVVARGRVADARRGAALQVVQKAWAPARQR